MSDTDFSFVSSLSALLDFLAVKATEASFSAGASSDGVFSTLALLAGSFS